jgi:hypothetical protein
MVTTGSQKITLWGPGGTPLGILRVKRIITTTLKTTHYLPEASCSVLQVTSPGEISSFFSIT